MTTKEPIHVTITGAAGQIAYSLLYNVARGDIYGLDQPVVLRLLDIPMCMDVVAGVVMELEDCALPLLAGVVSTTDPRIAFENADAALLVGAMPRKQGMERAELLQKNAKIFEEHGKIINEVAKKTIKVLVVGNPANTNALITMTNCPSIPRENFTCLTRLDHNRAKAQIALKANVSSGNVSNVIIWGNHSSTQYPDASHAVIRSAAGTQKAAEAVDAAWLQGEFVSTVQKRGGAVIDKRKLSSAMSAAKAIVDHMRDWIRGTPEGEIVSMGVASTGHYGVPEGLIFSFPVTCSNGTYKIVEGLNIDSFSRGKIDLTAEELLQERKEALGTQ